MNKWFQQDYGNAVIYAMSDKEVKSENELYINKRLVVRITEHNVIIIYYDKDELDFPGLYHEVKILSYVHRDIIKNIFKTSDLTLSRR